MTALVWWNGTVPDGADALVTLPGLLLALHLAQLLPAPGTGWTVYLSTVRLHRGRLPAPSFGRTVIRGSSPAPYAYLALIQAQLLPYSAATSLSPASTDIPLTAPWIRCLAAASVISALLFPTLLRLPLVGHRVRLVSLTNRTLVGWLSQLPRLVPLPLGWLPRGSAQLPVRWCGGVVLWSLSRHTFETERGAQARRDGFTTESSPPLRTGFRDAAACSAKGIHARRICCTGPFRLPRLSMPKAAQLRACCRYACGEHYLQLRSAASNVLPATTIHWRIPSAPSTKAPLPICHDTLTCCAFAGFRFFVHAPLRSLQKKNTAFITDAFITRKISVTTLNCCLVFFLGLRLSAYVRCRLSLPLWFETASSMRCR